MKKIIDGQEVEFTQDEWDAFIAELPESSVGFSGAYTLQMADFWSRFADDDEYETFNDAVSVAPLAKDRRAFNAAMFMLSDSPLFAWTKNVLTNSVSAERADIIMAGPSFAAASTDEAAA